MTLQKAKQGLIVALVLVVAGFSISKTNLSDRVYIHYIDLFNTFSFDENIGVAVIMSLEKRWESATEFLDQYVRKMDENDIPKRISKFQKICFRHSAKKYYANAEKAYQNGEYKLANLCLSRAKKYMRQASMIEPFGIERFGKRIKGGVADDYIEDAKRSYEEGAFERAALNVRIAVRTLQSVELEVTHKVTSLAELIEEALRKAKEQKRGLVI